jgi:hypothetical protein
VGRRSFAIALERMKSDNVTSTFNQLPLLQRYTINLALQISRPGSVFPQEVYEIIIGHLHSCRRALAKCALVCRVWVPASRYHLFYHIDIYPGDSRLLNLLTLPAASGNIASYVHSIKVVCRDYDPENGPDPVYEILIALRNTTPGYQSIVFHSLPFEYTKLREVLPLWRITDLEMNDCAIDYSSNLMALLGLMPNLQKLLLYTIYETGGDFVVVGATHLPMLRTLILGGTDIKAILCSVAASPMLRELESVVSSVGEMLCIGSFLHPVATHLVRLDINGCHEYSKILYEDPITDQRYL